MYEEPYKWVEAVGNRRQFERHLRVAGIDRAGDRPQRSLVEHGVDRAVSEVDEDTAGLIRSVDRILNHADEVRRLRVRANADTPEDSAWARNLGAEGIGLCRTEHMFLGDRLPIVQAMILADTPEAEDAAMAALLDQQRTDFEGILEAMDGKPVTVRLLDPHPPAFDAQDAVGRVAELEHVARDALHREVLVDRADERVIGFGDDAVVAGLGDRAAGGGRGARQACRRADAGAATPRGPCARSRARGRLTRVGVARP